MDETKTLNARDINHDPEAVYRFMRPYILVRDDSITGRFNELLEALAVLKDAGWDVVNMTYAGTSVLVLAENTHYKSKNG